MSITFNVSSIGEISVMSTPITPTTSRLLGDLWECVDRVLADAPCHLFVALYATTVWIVGTAAGASHKLLPLSFFLGAAQSASIVLVGGIAVGGLWSLALSMLTTKYSRRGAMPSAPALVSNVMLLFSLGIFLGVFSSMKQALTDIVPFFADPALARFDAFLHGQDVWRLTTAAMPPQLMPALEFVYLNCWGAGVIGCTLAAIFVPALREVRLQYVWTFLIIWSVLGNVVAGAAMSAGPIFYEHVTGDLRFQKLLTYLADHSRQAWVQDYLWSAYSGNQPGKAGAGISAFPSMHVASATLCALLMARAHRWLLWPAVTYCAMILFGSVHLGWHYAVDGYFAVVMTLLVWFVLGRALNRMDRADARTRRS